ncbi:MULTISPECIES: TadE/TadG family type IV pilus assembly protein [unclassified Crossiella]|uniref:TadE/TadG family type IV pilus assembly protein n=1 Tax=unclassified Crossiella TaxID=2620835 RepID=UPI001FFF947E|nr:MULTISPECIES: TadE/TadG family type IV pilus assembly protein [unclassified Crossiella]MCK2241863.1 pilus assembly protein [Crossiella sp. S99.2]MCK2255766.1 pilus assembly protein [Crossiella sp. S99.1]
MNNTTVHTGHSPMLRHRWKDRGAATVQLAVLLPLFFLLFSAATQAGVYWYARSLCQAAAQHGLQTVRTLTGTPAEGQAAARAFLERTGNGLVTNSAVSTTGSTPTTVRVEVTASVLRLVPIPGLDLRITRSVTGAKERFTTPNDTGNPR